MLRGEWDGRVEATLSDGRVLHCPGPVTQYRTETFHALSASLLVNPRFALREPDGLHLPGGWILPDAELPAPATRTDPRDVPLAAVPAEQGFRWLTATGARPGPASRQEALQQCPDLVQAGINLVRPGAVRRLSRHKGVGTVVLEGAHEVEVPRSHLPQLHRALGLAWPDSLAPVPPPHRQVYELGLRDWPQDLLHSSDEELRRRYADDPVRLVDDVIWEAYRRHVLAPDDGSATEHRGLYYNPLKVLASRAGLLDPEMLAPDFGRVALSASARQLLDASLPRDGLEAAGRSREDDLWLQLQLRLDLFIGEWRIFTYSELGFLDRGAPDRELGAVRPLVVLLVEKSSLQRDARVVARRFGASLLVLGGVPTWIATEFFCRMLQARPPGPVLIVSYCDFDPYGWRFPKDFSRQLERYGVSTAGILRLVKPSRFTEEELGRFAQALHPAPNQRKTVQEWVTESGGVHGEAKAVYADYLRPVQRVVDAFADETGLVQVEP